MGRSPAVKLDGDAKEIHHDALRSESSDIKKVGTVGCEKLTRRVLRAILAKNRGQGS